ncbi:hypothetical protein [Methanopyrus sp.]
MPNPRVLTIPVMKTLIVLNLLIVLKLFHSFTPALAQVYPDEYDFEEECQFEYYNDRDNEYDEYYDDEYDEDSEYMDYDQSFDESDHVDVGTGSVHCRGYRRKSFKTKTKPKKWILVVGLIPLPILILYYYFFGD